MFGIMPSIRGAQMVKKKPEEQDGREFNVGMPSK
jgi:hypothetical protein